MNATLRNVMRAINGDDKVIAKLEAELAESKRNASQAIEKLLDQRNELIAAANAALDASLPYPSRVMAKERYEATVANLTE